VATKQQAIRALKKHCKDALLIDEQPHDGYSVQLEAPQGHHWENSVHCQPVGFWYAGFEGKGAYWDLVIETIKSLPPAVPCIDDDCEGIQTWGECEYWNTTENQVN